MPKKFISLLTAALLAVAVAPAAASAVVGPKIDSGPPTLTNNASPSIAFNITEVSALSFSCSIDGAPEETCVSPLNLSNLSEGAHSVSIKAVYFGQTGETCIDIPPVPICIPTFGSLLTDPTVVSFTVDKTAPVAAITGGPKALSSTRKTTVTFTIGAEAGSGFNCTIDKKPITPCTSPVTLKKLKTGVHRFTVIPTDAAGNIGLTATHIFAVNSKTTTFKFNKTGTKVKRCITKKRRSGKKKTCKNLKV